MSKYQQLKVQMSTLQKRLETARKQEVASVVLKIKEMMAEFGLTIADLGRKAVARTSPPSKPKYCDPKSGKTWAGKGKPPSWIADAIKAGKKDSFLIEKAAAAQAPTAKKVVVKAAAPTPGKKASPTPPIAAKELSGAGKPTSKAKPNSKPKTVTKGKAPVKKPIAKAVTAATPTVAAAPSTPSAVAPVAPE